MALRSQSLRIARTLTKELHPFVQRSSLATSVWRPQNRQLVSNYSLSAQSSLASNGSYLRNFSAKPDETTSTEEAQSEGEADESTDDKQSTTEEGASASPSEETTDEGNKVAELETQIKDLKDNLLRSLAEQENIRRIAQRDVSNAKSFSIASFAKSLLDTSDNLTRALDAVPEDLRHDHENHPVLANLYEGITMTDDGLAKAFAKNGLKKFGAKGEKFDPNLHEALFEYPDPEGEPGNIGQVMKVGFMLNERVVRPAEVGVVKAP